MANTRPRLIKAIADKISNEDTRLVYQIPLGTFVDAEKPVLSYRATLSTGAALPAWLKFNAANQTFTGTPPKDFTGLLAIKVTASDGSLSASDTFNLRIAPVNDAPKLAKAIPDRSVLEENFWTYKIAPGTFTDVDNAALRYKATLVNGAALPAWLSFNAANQTFSGTPPKDFTGPISLRVTASDGTSSVFDDFNLNVVNINDPTIFRIPIPDRHGVKNNGTNKEQFNFRLPDGTFTDADSTITYTAKLVGGAALPTWLKFDPAGLTFRGIPPVNFTGTLNIVVTATDGLTTPVSDTFAITIRETNLAPKVIAPIPNQTITEDRPWTYKVPLTTFKDTDSTGLVYNATLANNQPLPGWLTFNPVTRTFAGVPPKDFNGVLDIVVSIDDGSRAVSDTFRLTITPTPDAPVLDRPLPDQIAFEDQAFSFKLPNGSFSDPDGGNLTYRATLASGAALPAWLTFNAATQTFTGTAPKNFDGAVNLKVIASDGVRSTSDTFVLDFLPANDAPVLTKFIADHHIDASVPFTYKIAAGTFRDVDSSLSYKATLANGTALPTWLKFNAATQTFTGTPPAAFTGPISVKVTATDGTSTASDTFILTDSAPILAHPIQDQTVGDGHEFFFAIPRNTFRDFDTAKLTYSAILANGTPLPGWLDFDPTTLTFTGTPPANWNGITDIKVIARDGTRSVSDTFRLTEGEDFELSLTGNTWGRDAPDEFHWRFDDFYYETSEEWTTGFDAGLDAGLLYGGIRGEIGFGYELQAGLLIDFTMRPSTYDIQYDFDVVEHVSRLPDVINKKPYVVVTGDVDPASFINAVGDEDGMALKAFFGVAGRVYAIIGGGIYGGLEIPDLDFGLLGTIEIPDITFDEGFREEIDLLSIGKQVITTEGVKTVGGSSFLGQQLGNVTGGVEIDLKGSDDPYEVSFLEGIGELEIKLPGGVDTNGNDITNVGANGLGTMHAQGRSAPFVSAGLDLDALVVEIVKKATGDKIDLGPLFEHEFTFAGNDAFGVKLAWESDFDLRGELMLQEDFYFTPEVYCSMKTSYGETIKAKAGEKVEFNTPEGEGFFTVDATYTTEADLRTVISLAGDLVFKYKLLDFEINAGIDVGPIDFDFATIDPDPVLEDKLSLGLGFAIPIYSNTDHFVFDTIRKHAFAVAYEKFRTVGGSGDSWNLTTHQILADGNGRANRFVGNTFDNIMNGLGGNDVFTGLRGDDRLDGGAGNDVLDGGADNDTLIGGDGIDRLLGGAGFTTVNAGAGNDIIDSGDQGSNIDAGAGNDVITTGAGADRIRDMLGVVKITDTGGNNHVTVGNQGNTVKLGAGNDTVISGFGNDIIDVGAGNNFVNAGNGTIKLTVANGNDTVITGSANDVLNVFAGNNVVRSGAGNDNITAGAGNDTVDAGAGNDTVDTGTGNNTIEGGLGDDRLIGRLGNDRITDIGGTNVITTGEGLNSVHGGIGFDTITGGSNVDTLDGGGGNDLVFGEKGNDVIHGGSGNDTVRGGLGVNRIFGDAGNDTLFGDVNNDRIEGGADKDTIAGGNGVNALFGDAGNDDITGGGATDTIDGGTGNDVLKGGAGRDTIVGAAGADRIIGGTGNDRLFGDRTDRTLTIEATDIGSDTFVFTPGCGQDVIGDINSHWSNPNTRDPAQIDVIDLSDYTNIVEFSDLNIVMSGGRKVINLRNGDSIALEGITSDFFYDYLVSKTTILYFGKGKDTIVGTAANDALNGGVDADTMTGLGGNDTFKVDNAGDVVIERINQGADTIISTAASYTLRAGQSVEVMQFRHATSNGALTGNDLANEIRGSNGNNTLSGQDGNDKLFANDGDDILIGGDGIDTLVGGLGKDRLEGGAGNDILHGDIIDKDTQTGDNDVILGGAGNDHIFGGLGNDIITGGLGADIMTGNGDGLDTLDGNDTFLYNSVAESTLAAFDRISDFALFGRADKIDVSAIDANTTLAGNQAFSIVKAATATKGQAAVHLVSGTSELNANWYIDFNTDNDAAIEMRIMLVKVVSQFGPDNFIL